MTYCAARAGVNTQDCFMRSLCFIDAEGKTNKATVTSHHRCKVCFSTLHFQGRDSLHRLQTTLLYFSISSSFADHTEPIARFQCFASLDSEAWHSFCFVSPFHWIIQGCVMYLSPGKTKVGISEPSKSYRKSITTYTMQKTKQTVMLRGLLYLI